MDIDSFIDELEKVCDCPNQGYIKCLEKVKELKEDNSRLYKAWDSVSDMVGKDIVSMKKEKDRHYINYMNSKMDIKKLKAENEKLKKMTDALDEQATDFCLQNKKLKEENEKLKAESE